MIVPVAVEKPTQETQSVIQTRLQALPGIKQ